MLSSFRMRNIFCEEEAKFTQDRIISTEKCFAEFCHIFAQYSRKVARVRDKGDALSKTITECAVSEEIDKSLALGLINFANSLTVISDYGDLRVNNIDKNVVKQFAKYENICKHAKEEVKQIFGARDKELNRKKQLDRIRERNPRNRQQIIQAETELVKATAEVAKTIHNLEEKITAFERQKLHDMKEILLDFVSSEMGYHARALEQLTIAYQDIKSINEETDLQAFQLIRENKELDFKKSLRSSELALTSKDRNVQSPFKISQSLGAINTLGKQDRSPGITTNRKAKLSKSAEDLDTVDADSSESESLQETSSEHTSEQSNEKPSPFIAKKYIK